MDKFHLDFTVFHLFSITHFIWLDKTLEITKREMDSAWWRLVECCAMAKNLSLIMIKLLGYFLGTIHMVGWLAG